MKLQDLNDIQSGSGVPLNINLPPLEYSPIILNYVYGIAGIILIFNIISTGFKMMLSQGDPKTLAAAQAKMTTSLIGILILFTSFFLVQVIMNFIGVNTILFK